MCTGETTKVLILKVRDCAEYYIALPPDGRTILYPQVDQVGSDLMLVRLSAMKAANSITNGPSKSRSRQDQSPHAAPWIAAVNCQVRDDFRARNARSAGPVVGLFFQKIR